MRRKFIAWGIGLLLLSVVCLRSGFAGPVYGKLLVSGKPGSGIAITIFRNKESYSATTDKDGSYTIQVNGTGRYTLKLTYANREITYTVFSYSRAIRYDLELQRSADGYTLRRR